MGMYIEHSYCTAFAISWPMSVFVEMKGDFSSENGVPVISLC